MNQPPKPAPVGVLPTQKDWSQAIANLALSSLDTKRDIDALKADLQQAFKAFMQLQQQYNQRFDLLEQRLSPKAVEKVAPINEEAASLNGEEILKAV